MSKQVRNYSKMREKQLYLIKTYEIIYKETNLNEGESSTRSMTLKVLTVTSFTCLERLIIV